MFALLEADIIEPLGSTLLPDSKNNQDGDKRLFELSARVDVLAERSLDVHAAANSGSAELARVEKTRTNRHSGSAGGDQTQSIELVFEGGSKVSRFQPGKESAREDSLSFLSRHEIKPDEIEKRLAAVSEGRDKLLSAAINEGSDAKKVEALGIAKDDVGSALTIYMLGAETASILGPKATKAIGDHVIVFGIAPLFGAFESGSHKVTSEQDKLAQRGASNVVLGTAIGYAIERAHPAVGAGALALGVGAISNELVTSPQAQERNAQLKVLADNTGSGLTPLDLVRYANHTKQSLGPAIFDGTFDLVIGGVSIPGAKQSFGHLGELGKPGAADVLPGASLGGDTGPVISGNGEFTKTVSGMIDKSLSQLGNLSAETWGSICALISDFPHFPNQGPRIAHAEAGAGISPGMAAHAGDKSASISQAGKKTFEDFVSYMSGFKEKFGRNERQEWNRYLGLTEQFEKAKIKQGKSGQIPEEVLAGLPDKNNIPAEIIEKYAVVKQVHPKACVAAVGEMLTKGAVKQEEFLQQFQLYVPEQFRKNEMYADLEWLNKELGDDFSSAFVKPILSEVKEFLANTKMAAVEIRGAGRISHVVLMHEVNPNGNVFIRDPLEGTHYELTIESFMEVWTGRSVFQKAPKVSPTYQIKENQK